MLRETEARAASDLTRAFQDRNLEENRGPLYETGDNLPIEVGHAVDMCRVKALTQGKIPAAVPPNIVLHKVVLE
jgi:hypothetical protein